MKRFVFKGVLAARTNRIFFWQQRHYADPPERPSYQPHTTEGVISGMKSEKTSRFSVIVRIPTGTPKNVRSGVYGHKSGRSAHSGGLK